MRSPNGPCFAIFLASVIVLAGVSATISRAGGPAPEVACPTCEDFDACTMDSCDTGTCRYDPIDCNDGNPCTSDSCTAGPTSVCQHVGLAPGTACDDGSSCSTGDTCNQSQQCMGTLLPSGSFCNDGDGCTISDTCRDGGICRGDPLQAGDGCEDGSLCTSGETCVNEGGTLVCRSPSPVCDDVNPCTQDRCDESTGLCIHPPVNCDDGNSCTGDDCDVATGSCVRTFLSGFCNDHNRCLTPDSCIAGNCVGAGPFGWECFDNNVCTQDSCDPVQGCLRTPVPCDDNNPCTFSACTQIAGCTHSPISCNDGVACTVDSCSPATGCTHLPNCDDGDSCTTDLCDATLGCMHSPVPIILDLKVDLLPMILAPANHKLVQVTATVSTPGYCGGALTIRLESITSSQPDDAAGQTDGHTIGDIQGAEFGTSDFSFLLRAENDRAASSPRVYTVTYSATGGGTSDTTSQTLTVKDQGKRSPNQVTQPKPKPAPKD